MTGKRGDRALTPKALGAMAEAVERSRASHTGTSSQAGPEPHGAARPPLSAAEWPGGGSAIPPAPSDESRRGSEAPPPPRRLERRLAVAVTATGVVVAVALVALAATLLGAGSSASHHGAVATTVTPPPSRTTRPSASTTTPSPPVSTPATTVPLPAGPGPVLVSLDPSRGAANQSVVISGRGFLSPNGQIVARFDGQVAPTRCPVQNTCTVTVPDLAGPPSSTMVTITTQSGTSNALPFMYV